MNAIKVATYENGISYYPVRIKHFGDDLTPWKKTEAPEPTVSGGAYPTANQAANYLGRYGVLRNNWYNIDVTGIKNLVPQLFLRLLVIQMMNWLLTSLSRSTSFHGLSVHKEQLSVSNIKR